MRQSKGVYHVFWETDVSSPIGGLDRTDCKILERLNRGSETPTSMIRTRIDKLLDSGLIAENTVGEVSITLRGQLEIARWRYRNLAKGPLTTLGEEPSKRLFEKFFKLS